MLHHGIGSEITKQIGEQKQACSNKPRFAWSTNGSSNHGGGFLFDCHGSTTFEKTISPADGSSIEQEELLLILQL